MKAKNNIDRRKFLDLSIKGSVAAMAAAHLPAWAQDEYGGYSGNKDYKYLTQPATVFDFGLTPEQEQHAKELHKNIVVFDGLMECSFFEGLIPLLKIGGATAGNMSLGIAGMFAFTPDNIIDPADWWTWDVLKSDLAKLPHLMRTFDEDAMLTTSYDDIIQAKKLGKVGFMPGTQNTQFLGRDIKRLKQAYDMGLRIIQLTYNPTNYLGSGSMEQPDSRFGLSELGERVVGEMNELGMLVDTGHCSPETMIKAAEVSTKPTVISHAGMYSKVAQFRSTTDEALRKVAEKGGCVGVISTPSAIASGERCTVEDYLDNIEHAINIAGVDGVGFGSDFIQPATFEQVLTAPSWDPEIAASIGSFSVWPWSDGHVGWENSAGMPNMTRGLIKRGYSDSDIAKIMGGNFMRVIKETIG